MVTPPPDMDEPGYVIGYRDEWSRRIRYYRGMNGVSGKASCGGKSSAVVVDQALGAMILRQLPSLDARDWQLVKCEKRCRFA